MKFTEVPEGSKFLDVDGIAVVTLPDGECIAFTDGSGTEVDSRPYPNASKAGHEGGPMSKQDFATWLRSGYSPFETR